MGLLGLGRGVRRAGHGGQLLVETPPRPHVALVDELHEHPTNHVVEMLRAGFKSRREPLMFAITNSGSDKTSPCGQYHTYALQVCAGVIDDDAFFGLVCNLDETEDRKSVV